MVQARKLRQIGGRQYRAWKEWEEGDYIIAKFLKHYEDNFDNPGYEVEIIECVFENEGAEFAVGSIVGLNSAGGLNYKMGEVELDDIIKVEYGGKDVMSKGKFKGKEFHVVNMWLVEADEQDIPDPVNESRGGLL